MNRCFPQRETMSRTKLASRLPRFPSRDLHPKVLPQGTLQVPLQGTLWGVGENSSRGTRVEWYRKTTRVEYRTRFPHRELLRLESFAGMTLLRILTSARNLAAR